MGNVTFSIVIDQNTVDAKKGKDKFLSVYIAHAKNVREVKEQCH